MLRHRAPQFPSETSSGGVPVNSVLLVASMIAPSNNEPDQPEEIEEINVKDQKDEQELNPIESVKSAMWRSHRPTGIGLMEQYPNNPTAKGITQNIINSAKANATDEELEEIKRLENQAFEF